MGLTLRCRRDGPDGPQPKIKRWAKTEWREPERPGLSDCMLISLAVVVASSTMPQPMTSLDSAPAQSKTVSPDIGNSHYA